MGEETNPKPAATEAMDVDGAAAFPVAVEGSGEVASLLDKLMANVVLIDHAVMTKEQKLISSRLLRQTQGLKKELTPQGVIDFVKRLFSDGGAASMDDGEGLARRTGGNLERITRALGECASLAEGAPLDLDVARGGTGGAGAARWRRWQRWRRWRRWRGEGWDEGGWHWAEQRAREPHRQPRYPRDLRVSGDVHGARG
jgi:hypothetical protein